MRRNIVFLPPCLVLLGLLATILLPRLTGAAPDARQPLVGEPAPLVTPLCGQMVVVSSPNMTSTPLPSTTPNSNYLQAVAAAGPADVWASGNYITADSEGNPVGATLMEHWNGTSWSIVPSPDGGGLVFGMSLAGLVALAPNDVWAVGDAYSQFASPVTWTQHWDGQAWTQISSPSPANSGIALSAVDGVAANDVWAVGGAGAQSLALHWTGTAWTQVPSPAQSTFYGVAALAANDVWAVGEGSGTLIAHWNGTAWSRVPSPNPQGGGFLYGVTALAQNDIWAVGRYQSASGQQVLVLHWNGTTWLQVPGISPGPQATLVQVSAGSSGDVWAAGSYQDATGTRPLVERWDGQAWRDVPVPAPSEAAAFSGIAVAPGGAVWAVGTRSGPPATTLIERYAGPCSSPTPAPTLPPGTTPTVPPTVPPTATATPAARCPGAPFADVCPADWFYTATTNLTSRGAISGYTCGGPGEPCYPGNAPYFRPYNAITRAQLVKVALLAFAIPLSSTAPIFADVPPGHPFFAFVNTAANVQLVSGYACGGPGEPCDAQQRPYFRPAIGVTRGQLAKIAVRAAGWALLNPPAGSFADVLPGSAFYAFVETAVAHNIISGYACGGVGEPCDPGNRPYFRQYSDVTRAQCAKIVYLSLASGLAHARSAAAHP